MIIACVLTVLLSCNNWTYSKIWTGVHLWLHKVGLVHKNWTWHNFGKLEVDLAQFWQTKSGPGPILAS